MAPGVREGIRCDQIQLQGMSVCWHWWIDTTDGADPAPWTASSQHHWSDLCSFLQWFILTAGFTFLPALHLWFWSSLPLFPTSSSSSQWRSALCPPLCLLFFSIAHREDDILLQPLWSAQSVLGAAGARQVAASVLPWRWADSIAWMVQPTWLCGDTRNGL